MKVFINGLGTVGSRVARALRTLGVEVHGAKYSAHAADRKTQDLLALQEEFGPIPVYVADGDNLERRVQEFDRLGIPRLHTLDLSAYDALIDAAPDDVAAERIPAYAECNKPFIIQGGSDVALLENDFLSSPEAVGCTRYGQYRHGGARHISCNATFAATALGIVHRRLRTYDDVCIESVDMRLYRRFKDPGERKDITPKPLLKPSHHAQDVMNVLPRLDGRVSSQANTNPWEHFHRTEILVTLNKPAADDLLTDITRGFKAYSRGIYNDEDIGEEDPRDGITQLLTVSHTLGIPDGDLLLPVYSIKPVSPATFMIAGYTPQRSIIVPSCVDWVWAATGKQPDAPSAMLATNSTIRWHGHSIYNIKKNAERMLSAREESAGLSFSERVLDLMYEPQS